MVMILVTGSTGNVGAPLVRRLHEEGAPVRAAMRDSGRGAPAGVQKVAFDFARPETFEPALAGVSEIFLLRPPEMSDPKTEMTPFLRAARRAGASRVVFLSLLGVERAPFMPHARIERLLEAEGLPCTSLRAGFFMQNLGVAHREEIRERGEIFVPAGAGKTSFVDARDLADVAAKALLEPEHAGKAYDLTGASALDFTEVAALMSRILGKPIRYRAPGAAHFVLGSVARGRPIGMSLVMAGIYTVTRLGRAAHVSPTLGELLGRPPTTLERYVEEHVHLWR